MSLIHKITPSEPVTLLQLNTTIASSGTIAFQYRGPATCYYWMPGKSARGMDVTIFKDRIEVRNTVLSNSHDYRLTNMIVGKIMSLATCYITDEDGDPIEELPLFDDSRMEGREDADCELLKTLLAEATDDIAVNGPVRNVYFGKRVRAALQDRTGAQLKDKVFGMIYKSQWGLPALGYGDVVQLGEAETAAVVKVLEPGASCLIDKYDFLLLDREPGRPVMITNEILNNIIPAAWTLVDEYTIVAPGISGEAWNALLERALPFDMFDAFLSQRHERRIPNGQQLPRAWRASA